MPSGKRYPTMISAITRNNQIIGIHKAHLEHDGSKKAQIFPNKMILGTAKGGAIQLSSKIKETLVIAEGIENALSVMIATRLPAWSTVSSSGIASLEMLKISGFQNIIIASDNDSAGIVAANQLTERIADNYLVSIATPKHKNDFNNLLLEV